MGILAYEYDTFFVSFGEPTKTTKAESRHRGKRRHKIMEALQNRRGCCPNQEASRVRRMMPRSGAAIDSVACSPRPELPGSRPTFDERMRRTYRSACDTFVAGCLCWRLLNPQHNVTSAQIMTGYRYCTDDRSRSIASCEEGASLLLGRLVPEFASRIGIMMTQERKFLGFVTFYLKNPENSCCSAAAKRESVDRHRPSLAPPA